MSLTKKPSQTREMKRWVVASIIKLFKEHTEGITLYVEGMDNNSRDKDKHFELRIDGPYVRPLTKGEYRYYFEVNILVNSSRAEDDSTNGITYKVLLARF